MRKRLIAWAACFSVLFSACNIVDVTEVGAINGEKILKSQYLFYLEQGKLMAMNMAQQQGQSITKERDWTSVTIEGVSAAEYAKNKAKDYLKESFVMRHKAAEYGIELAAEDEETVSQYKNQLIEQFGGRYEYRERLKEIGLTEADLTVFAKDAIYANKLWQKLSEEEDFTNVSDEEVLSAYNEKYVMAKHILIQPKEEELPSEEGDESPEGEEAIQEPKSAEELDAEARDTAQGILDRLLKGENFDTLMNEFSEDPGLAQNPDGYLFTKGQMVPEFEEATFNLGIGEITKELVKSDHGYHIIKRMENPTSGEEFENAKESLKNELLSKKSENTINKWAEEFGFTLYDNIIDKIKITA